MHKKSSIVVLALSALLASLGSTTEAANSLDWVWNTGGSQANNNYNGLSSYDPYRRHYNNHHRHDHYPRRFCQVVRKIHPVQYVSYSDNTGRWALYTQIMETRNVGNHCNRNEVALIAHRKPSGWFWNSKRRSLLHYTEDEPRFATRRVRDPFNPRHHVNVSLSRSHQSQNASIQSVFSDFVATSVLEVGNSDAKWLELARRLTSQMNQKTLYFQYVKRHRNALAVPLHPLPPAGSRLAMEMAIRE